MSKNNSLTETAYFGGGCFWCTEAVYSRLNGVISVTPGYGGGLTVKPSYHQVSSGATGHAEIIKIIFDPQQISFQSLLDVFFATHDPTTADRQGADVGTQYRSIILYANADQQAIAQKVVRRLNESNQFPRPIVTQLVPLTAFYPAEKYHQRYYEEHSSEPYCRFVINPKLQKLTQHFSPLLHSNRV